MEIQRIAGSTNVCDDVIRYIANSRECSKNYAVKLALVTNPKCPLGSSLRFLAYLHPDDLRNISRSKNIPGRTRDIGQETAPATGGRAALARRTG
jgi:hypothetical protein